MAGIIDVKRTIWSVVMGIFILAGGFMFFITFFLVYILSLVYVYSGNVPGGSWSFLVQAGIICFFLYAVGGFLWNLGRGKEPSIDRRGRLIFSVSLFLTGSFLLLIVAFLATRPHSLTEQMSTDITWVNACAAGACIFLMCFSLYNWIRTRRRTQKKTMVCPQCGLYIPEDSDSCSRCGALLEKF